MRLVCIPYYSLHLNQPKHATHFHSISGVLRQPLENSTDLVSLSQSSPYSWAERPALDIHVYLYGIAARLQFKAVSHELLPASVRTGDYDDSKGWQPLRELDLPQGIIRLVAAYTIGAYLSRLIDKSLPSYRELRGEESAVISPHHLLPTPYLYSISHM